MQIDLYTKAVLTVIAVCLSWMCLTSVDLVPSTYAQGKAPLPSPPVLPVKIVEFNMDSDWALPVNIRTIDEDFEHNNINLPVKLVEVDDELGETDATFTVHVANDDDLK